MITTPITNSHFHSRVLSLLSSHLPTLDSPSFDAVGTRGTSSNTKAVTVPPLSPADTPLTPSEAISQVVGITSSWIDLCSPDPLIAEISRQVLMLEVSYAAFCGISYLVIPGPRLQHGDRQSEGLAYYGRTIQEALSVAPYIQFHIWLKIIETSDSENTDMGDLSPFARAEFADLSERPTTHLDSFATWDAWEIIRTICKHHSRLLIGKRKKNSGLDESKFNRCHSSVAF